MAQMRGAFPFPPTAPQTMGIGGVITLAPGRICVVPMGEFIVIPGQQTVLEFFDPLNLLWRGTQVYQGQAEQISSDGSNYRLVNLSGVVVGGNITNAGSGGTNGIGPIQTGSTVTFAAPGSGLASDTAQGYVIVGGTIAAPTISQAGSQFLVPPLIVCDPPPIGGIQATFTATINAAGGLATITQVNPGAGYTSVPQFYIIPQFQFYNGSPRWPGDTVPLPGVPGGTNWAPGLINPAHLWNGSPYQGNLATGTIGALLTPPAAVGGSGTLTGIVMTQYGAGYTGATIPAITFGGTSLGAAAATAIMSMCANAASITLAGAGFTVGNPMITGLGLVASSNDNNLFTPRPIRGIVTNANGSFSVEDPGFGIQKALAGNLGTLFNVTLAAFQASTAVTYPAASLGGATDFSILQGQVQ